MLLGNRRPGFRPSKPSEPSEPSDDDQADDDNTTETTYTVEVGYVNGDGTVTLCSTHYGITDLESFVPTTTSSDKVETWDTSVLYNRDLTLYTDAVTEGDMLFRATDNTTNAVYCIYAAVPSSEDTGTDDSTGADDSAQQGQAGAVGGMGGGSRGNSSAPAFEPYTLDQLTVASVTSQEHMSLEITVDEQDIFRLYTGQEAVITVEALTGQTFPAVVTNVSNTGTNEGGSSKFTARLTLNKSGDMLPGMNASAFLTLNTAENTISVPVAALVEENGQTIVYTGYNENDDVLTKPVTVTTGLSDGEYVQILSGLREGDAIYYAYYDTPEISTIPERRRFGF